MSFRRSKIAEGIHFNQADRREFRFQSFRRFLRHVLRFARSLGVASHRIFRDKPPAREYLSRSASSAPAVLKRIADSFVAVYP
jgi:hypothetical protein